MPMTENTAWAVAHSPIKARDVMTSKVISVRADTPTREIARLLLENHISAVPVLDGSGTPIGMVSEGDLMKGDEGDGATRRDWWLTLLAEGSTLSPEFLASLREPQRTAGELMSRPIITVSEDTDTIEIARLLQTYRIKRVPVVRDGQVVGIVSRENLLRALVGETNRAVVTPKTGPLAEILADLDRRFGHTRRESEPPVPTGLSDETRPTAKDFRALVADCENRKAQHDEEVRRSAEEQRARAVTELMEGHSSEEDWRGRIRQARYAAEQGAREYMLLRFPSQLCSDAGRAINVGEPDWPATLRGEAAELYLRWERELRPQGFHLAARVLDFPGGRPGDVGLFLVWGQ